MDRRGFTLLEILIVLAIAGVLLSIAIPQYGVYVRRRSMEKQIREIQSDITSFRLSAIHRKERHRILLGPLLLHFQWFNPATGAWEPALGNPPLANTGVPPAKALKFEIQRLRNDGTFAPFVITAANQIEFNERGYALDNTLSTIVVVPVDLGMGDACIIVDRARNNLGRMVNGNTCQAN